MRSVTDEVGEGHGESSDAAPKTGLVVEEGEAGSRDELVSVSLTELVNRPQRTALPVPMVDPSVLPLAQLDPEVLERVVAELVSVSPHLSVSFYGRRGQKQYGLDVLERRVDRRYTVYQVKRYQTLTTAQIAEAVAEYAIAPNPPDGPRRKRRFDADRFVLVTSASFDDDTALADKRDELQRSYDDDLDIVVWGAEAISRKLRHLPHLVQAVFGPEWARAFCGVEDPSTAAPPALGFVEDPVEVLGLTPLRAEATARESSDPLTAAAAFGTIAEELVTAGFPGHAGSMRRRQADVLRLAGRHDDAFDVLFALGLGGAITGATLSTASYGQALETSARAAGGERLARWVVLDAIDHWTERGLNLSEVVPALEEVAAAAGARSDVAVLACLVLEQTVVDGLFDTDPPDSVVSHTDETTAGLLARLRSVAESTDPVDRVLRARLGCALADSATFGPSTEGEVQQAFGRVVDNAAAGLYGGSGGLAAARAARAFAVAGALERSELLWRQAALRSSEDRLFGDTRGALRAIQYAARERGTIPHSVDDAIAALPDRRRLLAAGHDSSADMLEAAHNGQLPDAFSSARQALWEARLGGHWADEQIALSYFADVLDQADRRPVAVRLWVASGQPKKAAEAAATLSEVVDVAGSLADGSRHQKIAAAAVISAQAAAFPDADVAVTVDRLLDAAEGLWSQPALLMSPQLQAVRAIAAFGVRIPPDAVDRILDLMRPGVAGNRDDIANLLVQTLYAVPSRFDDVAPLVLTMLDREHPATKLAGLIAGLPDELHSRLRPRLHQLIDAGRPEALDALNDIGVTLSPEGQVRARQACARLLRRPLGIERHQVDLTTEFGETARLISLLADVAEPADVSADRLVPSRCEPLGGLVFSTAIVPSIGAVPLGGAEATNKPPGGADDDVVDEAAQTASGSPALVLAATFERLMGAAADEQEGVPMRLQAMQASRMLLPRLPASARQALAGRLVEVSDDPGFTELDDFNRQSLDPLSRSTFNTGESGFSRDCLFVAADAAASAIEAAGLTDELRGIAQDIARRASVLLRSTDAEDRARGAATLRLLAHADDELRLLTSPLRSSHDPAVRWRGISTANVGELSSFVSDPSPMVRVQVAARAGELDEVDANRLVQDLDLRVRTAARQAVLEAT